jgi:hypothetical protein
MSKSPFEDLKIIELQEKYDEVLKSGVTVQPEPLPSFLHISGFPHYEEVISNWYAFFFNTSNPHGFGTLFIDSLIELINESNPNTDFPTFERCQVIREKYVDGKSIDLLLYDDAIVDQGKESYRNAIIIENKVFAALYNDLDFYIGNIKTDENKIGIVLSITPLNGMPTGYTSITHGNLIEKISSNLGRYLLYSNEKYILLLKDFIQQIILFRKTDNMKEYVNFYFQNAEKINELSQIRTKAMDVVIEELAIALTTTNFQRRRRYPDAVNIRCRLHPNILMVLQTAQIFEKAIYTLELWFTTELAKSFINDQDMKSKIWEETKVPDGFTFNKAKTGDKYALIGKQEKDFGKKLEDIQQLPSAIATNLELQWVQFIAQMLQTMHITPSKEFETTDTP